MSEISIDLREISAATRATHYRIDDGKIELFRRCPGGQEVGHIDGNQVIWQRDWRSYPPEDSSRL